MFTVRFQDQAKTFAAGPNFAMIESSNLYTNVHCLEGCTTQYNAEEIGD